MTTRAEIRAFLALGATLLALGLALWTGLTDTEREPGTRFCCNAALILSPTLA